MNRTTETIGNATGTTGWRKTWQRNWTPPAQACGAWGRKMKQDAQAQALQAFGADRQVDKCIEELGELATALVKYRHGEATAEQVIDELADVDVTTGTLWLLFDRKSIEARIAVKLARLQRLVADQVQANAEKVAQNPLRQPTPGKTLCADCPHWHPVMDHPSEYGVCHHPAKPWDTAERRAKDGPYLAATNREEACLLPVPTPVKPVLRWEAGGDDGIFNLWNGDKLIGQVRPSTRYIGCWMAEPFKDRYIATMHALRAVAMNVTSAAFGYETVPVWTP